MESDSATFDVVHIDPVKPDLPVESKLFESAGVHFEARRCHTDDEVVEFAQSADAILCLGYPMTAQLLERCPNLKVIVRYGIGVDNIDVVAATQLGIAVCNVPDYCIDEVANHTMAFLLALNRKLIQQDRGLRSATPVPLRPMGALRGETLGMVGYGRLARAVAERASAFGLRIIAYDPFVSIAESSHVTLLELDEVLGEADYLTIHLPLTQQTRGLIGSDALARMKSTSYVINTSRGGIIDEHALDEALKSGTIAGAAFDVWSEEPVSSSNPLLAHENFVATPHTAFFSDQSLVTLRRRVVENALGVLHGSETANVVNQEVLNRPLGDRS